jgi:hypothetical protein
VRGNLQQSADTRSRSSRSPTLGRIPEPSIIAVGLAGVQECSLSAVIVRTTERNASDEFEEEDFMRVTAPLVALLAAACAVSASASGAAKDPMSLVFQRSDFPANAHLQATRNPSVDKTLAAAGLEATSADYSAEIPHGSTDTLHVSGRVIVLANATQARRLFAQYKGDLALTMKVVKIVELPAYGDEQSAFTQAQPGTRADLRVRKGAVVWRVEVKWGGVEKLTPTQALTELKTYAAKLKQRVGSG